MAPGSGGTQAAGWLRAKRRPRAEGALAGFVPLDNPAARLAQAPAGELAVPGSLPRAIRGQGGRRDASCADGASASRRRLDRAAGALRLAEALLTRRCLLGRTAGTGLPEPSRTPEQRTRAALEGARPSRLTSGPCDCIGPALHDLIPHQAPQSKPGPPGRALKDAWLHCHR